MAGPRPTRSILATMTPTPSRQAGEGVGSRWRNRRPALRDPAIVERILSHHAARPGLRPILDAPCGQGGFGYDPVFYFPALKKTFAELSTEEKNRHSHRGKAFRRLLGLMR